MDSKQTELLILLSACISFNEKTDTINVTGTVHTSGWCRQMLPAWPTRPHPVEESTEDRSLSLFFIPEKDVGHMSDVPVAVDDDERVDAAWRAFI